MMKKKEACGVVPAACEAMGSPFALSVAGFPLQTASRK